MNRHVPRELTLRDLTQAFARRRSLFLWICCISVLASVVVCALSTKEYESKGTIEMQSPIGDGLDRQTLMGDAPAASDPLAADITVQTQAKVLQSDTLALRTIAALTPEDRRNLLPHGHLFHMPHKTGNAASNNPLSSATDALPAFRRNLTVKSVGGTRLIEISYLNANPKTSAAVVNELIHQLVAFGEETRLQATDEAAKSLSKELEGLRTQAEAQEKRVAAMQVKTGMYDEGSTDSQGREQTYSAVLEQFQRAATTLSDATQNRILKEAIYHVARTGDAELISSLAGNTGTGAASAGVMNSLGTVQNLRVSESQLQEQLDQLRVKFGPRYPKVIELQAGIAGLEKSIHEEIVRITDRAQNDSAVADRTWNDAQENYNKLKVQADTLNSRTIDYRMAQQEADESRTLYADLTKRLDEAGILQNLQSNTIGIVDSARAPRLPSKPAIPLYLGIGVFLGIFAGMLGIAIAELLDDTVNELSVVEDMGLGLSGIVPRQLSASGRSGSELSRYNDAIRSIRAKLTCAKASSNAMVIVISPVTPVRSAHQLAVGLTRSGSRAGHRVLLVEANLRTPGALGEGSGTVELNKIGEGEANDTIKLPQNVAKVYLLAPGETDQDPPPILESGRMHELVTEWRTKFDLIVIDAPSVLFQPDATLLSKEADAIVQVVTYGVTTKTSLQRSTALLSEYSGKPMTVVVEDVPVKSMAYRNYYGSSGTGIYMEKLTA